jgi:hypothetical protein
METTHLYKIGKFLRSGAHNSHTLHHPLTDGTASRLGWLSGKVLEGVLCLLQGYRVLSTWHAEP